MEILCLSLSLIGSCGCGVKVHCCGVKDYTGKLVEKGEGARTLSTSYRAANTPSNNERGYILQADSFHHWEKDAEQKESRERRKIEKIHEGVHIHACAQAK